MHREEQESTHELLLRAIRQKRLIQFKYQEKVRIAEPHDYGIQNGQPRLLCYQLRGQSTRPLPNWRLIKVPGISDLKMLAEEFLGSRGNESKQHYTWDKVHARVA